MNWKTEAVEKLSEYDARKAALGSIPEELKRLELAMTGIRCGGCDGVKVAGGGKREDQLLSMLVKKEELENLLEQTKIWVRRVEAGLKKLEDTERTLLERFYISPEKYAAESLAGELCVDIKTVYRWKDAAIRKFTMCLYGAVEG